VKAFDVRRQPLTGDGTESGKSNHFSKSCQPSGPPSNVPLRAARTGTLISPSAADSCKPRSVEF
jgi:hypothetical protein